MAKTPRAVVPSHQQRVLVWLYSKGQASSISRLNQCSTLTTLDVIAIISDWRYSQLWMSWFATQSCTIDYKQQM
jgi:hypothetical protein